MLKMKAHSLSHSSQDTTVCIPDSHNHRNHLNPDSPHSLHSPQCLTAAHLFLHHSLHRRLNKSARRIMMMIMMHVTLLLPWLQWRTILSSPFVHFWLFWVVNDYQREPHDDAVVSLFSCDSKSWVLENMTLFRYKQTYIIKYHAYFICDSYIKHHTHVHCTGCLQRLNTISHYNVMSMCWFVLRALEWRILCGFDEEYQSICRWITLSHTINQ